MRIILIAGLLCLSACQTAPIATSTFGPTVIAPPAAVLAAADAAPRGYPGSFGFVVVRADMLGPNLYLNSHPDYRDQRNLTVVITPFAMPALRRRFGSDLRQAFLNKSIVIDGVARRTRIDFVEGGRPTGLYYYQTHVEVTRADQLTIAG